MEESDEDEQEMPCEVCGGTDDADRTLLCDRCSEGCCHFYCATPKVRKAPTDEGIEWICQGCHRLKNKDVLVKHQARVRVKWAKYGTHFGECIDVRWEKSDDDDECPKPGGAKEYLIFYKPGDEQWSAIEPSEVLARDETATREQKARDELIGERIEVEMPHVQGYVRKGWYVGTVLDCCVEKPSGAVLHLVDFDVPALHVRCGLAIRGSLRL